MPVRHTILIVVALSLLASRAGFADGEGKTVVGKVQETGWGKFKVLDEDGTVRLFHISKKGTSFSPADWRPMVGDKISIKYSEFQRRSATIAQIDSVTLIEAGPDTPRISSPVEVEIREAGYSGFNVKILESGKLVKFSRHKGTQMEPVGWTPSAGEKAKITFSVKSGRIMIFDVTYVADKIEKVKAPEKTE